jgi:hypothetical protein
MEYYLKSLPQSIIKKSSKLDESPSIAIKLVQEEALVHLPLSYYAVPSTALY